MESLNGAVVKMEEIKKSSQEDVDSLKNHFRAPSSDAKKSSKAKSLEKLEAQLETLQAKLNLTVRPRMIACNRLDAVIQDSALLLQRLQPPRSSTPSSSSSSSSPVSPLATIARSPSRP